MKTRSPLPLRTLIATPPRPRLSLPSLGLLLAAAMISSPATMAASFTWSGATNGSMITGSNWGGSAPGSDTANDWIFSSNTSGLNANNDIANPCLVHNMTHSVSMTFQGSPFSLGGTTPTVSIAPGTPVTYNNNLVIGTGTKLTSTVTTANTSTVTFGGQLSGAVLQYSTTTTAANLTIKFAGSTGNTLSGFTIGDGTASMNAACPIQIAMDNPFGAAGSTLFMNRAECVFTVLGANRVVASGIKYRGSPVFNGGFDLALQGNGVVDNTSARSVNSNLDAGKTLTLGTASSTWDLKLTSFSGTGMGVLAAIVSDSSTVGFTKAGVGTWRLTNNNTYATPTWVQNGTLEFNSVVNKSATPTACALGKPTTVDGTKEVIALGTTTTAGTLKYVGTLTEGHSTDRGLKLVGTTGGGTLDASGTGPISFLGGVKGPGVGTKTLTLTGASTGANTLGGEIVNNSGYTLVTASYGIGATSVTLASVDTVAVGATIVGTGINTTVASVDPVTKVVGLTVAATVAGTNGQTMTISGVVNGNSAATTAVAKTGEGTWTLTGANTYAGGTTVSAGKLLVNNSTGSGSGTGTTTVSGTGTLGGSGTLIGALAVNAGTLAPGAGIGTLTNNLTGSKTATFATGAIFAFDLGAPGTSDALAFAGLTAEATSSVTFNNNVINFTNAGGLSAGIYTLFTFDADNAYNGTPVIGTGLDSYDSSTRLVLNPGSIQLEVVASSAPQSTLSIVKTNDGAEEGPVDGLFTLSRDNPTAAVTVYFSTTGTATAGTDYTALPASVTMGPGVDTATVTVAVHHDNDFSEGAETVVVTLTPDATYIVGTSNTATVDIADGTKPVVTIAKATDGTEVGPVSGSFTVTRSTGENTAYALTVHYATDGSSTAVSGTDYSALSGSVTLLANQTTATITVPVLQDNDFTQVSQSVILNLSENAAYTLGAPATATMSISEGVKPEVTLVKTADGAEVGPVNGSLTVTRTDVNGTTNPLIVNYTIDALSTATAGTDYATLPGTVTIGAGSLEAIIPVAIHQDTDFAESPAETIIVNLTAESYYALGTANSATVSISDGTKPVVSIVTTTDGAEDGPVNGVFTVNRSPESASSGPVTVGYTHSGTATSGDDYTALPGSVTLGLGVTSATITVPVLHDYVFEEGSETVVLTLNASSAYTLDTSSSASLDITDITAPVLGDPYAFEALYPFTNTVVGTVTDPTPVPYAPGIQFGSFAMVGGSRIGTNTTAGQFIASDWDVSTTIQNALAYFEVTVTPAAPAGQVSRMTLSTLAFDVARQKDATTPVGPVNWAVRSSLDGYTANLGNFTIDPANANLTAPLDVNSAPTSVNVGTNAATMALQTGAKLTLDPGALGTFTNLTTPVTFRVYGWTNGADKDGGIDNFKVTGSWKLTTADLVADAGADKSVSLGSPSVTIGGAPTAVGGIKPHTYSWTSDPAGFTSSDANPSVSPTVTTTYTVTVSDSADPVAEKTDSVTVTYPLAVDAGADRSIAPGTPTVLGGSTPASGGLAPYVTYSWSPSTGLSDPNVATPTATPSVTTTYTLTVTDSATPTAATQSDSVKVTCNLVADAGADRMIAVGASMDLGGTTPARGGNGAYTYSWSSEPAGFTSSDAKPTATPTVTTTYTLTLTDSDGTPQATDPVTVTVGSAFNIWALNMHLDGTAGKESGANDDPDKDGVTNLAEFAFNGDPLNAASRGKIYALTEVSSDFGNQKVLVLTAAVRSGTAADWTANANTATMDGIIYTIEGGTSLGSFASDTGTVFSAPAPITTGLPADPGTGYQYRSFILSNSSGLSGKGFLRATVNAVQ